MEVKFNLEGMDFKHAFLAIYSSLRVYKEQQEKNTLSKEVSIHSTIIYSLLQDLEYDFPKEFNIAKEKFKNNVLIDFDTAFKQQQYRAGDTQSFDNNKSIIINERWLRSFHRISQEYNPTQENQQPHD